MFAGFAGEENAVRVKVYGTKGGVEWCQEDENTLLVKHGAPNQIYRTGVDNSYLTEAALVHARVPSGHPEGYLRLLPISIEILPWQFELIIPGQRITLYDFADINDGIHGMALVDAMVESTTKGNVWSSRLLTR